MRDLRDPQKVGEALLNEMEAFKKDRLPVNASTAAEYLVRYDIPDYDEQAQGPLERYGDPRARQAERIANGTEPTL